MLKKGCIATTPLCDSPLLPLYSPRKMVCVAVSDSCPRCRLSVGHWPSPEPILDCQCSSPAPYTTGPLPDAPPPDVRFLPRVLQGHSSGDRGDDFLFGLPACPPSFSLPARLLPVLSGVGLLNPPFSVFARVRDRVITRSHLFFLSLIVSHVCAVQGLLG